MLCDIVDPLPEVANHTVEAVGVLVGVFLKCIGALFFSTHALNLLRGLWRDEATFVEKDGNGASSVFSAADLRKLRKRDDLRTVYKKGMV